jgi:succinate dehydrogenase/fumarate reductase flavoprotein subunit
MGGIWTDVECRTKAGGVLAAGECACVSVHGANRLGGNSLLEAVVFGRRAGRNAAAARGNGRPPGASAARDELARIDSLLSREQGELPVDIRGGMEEAMRASFGLFKDEAGMRRGLEEIEGLSERYERVVVRDKGEAFNLDLVRALELGCMLDVARISAEASLRREESRGGHYRTDFPKMDNDLFLRHSIATRSADGGIGLSYEPVTIEDVEPEAEVRY